MKKIFSNGSCVLNGTCACCLRCGQGQDSSGSVSGNAAASAASGEAAGSASGTPDLSDQPLLIYCGAGMLHSPSRKL